MNDRKNNIKKNIDKTKPVRKPVKGNFARKNTTETGRKKADYRQGGNDNNVAVKKSRCPYFKKCGACQMIDTPYKKQLNLKHARLAELLEPYTKVESFIGMESPEHYRCKVHAVFTHDRKGNPVSGSMEKAFLSISSGDMIFFCLSVRRPAAFASLSRIMVRSFL